MSSIHQAREPIDIDAGYKRVMQRLPKIMARLRESELSDRNDLAEAINNLADALRTRNASES